MKLKPIETAPRDGTFILLFGPSGYVTTPLPCEVGRWYPEFRPLNPWQTFSNDAYTDGGGEPTHWLPLPNGKDEEKILHEIHLEVDGLIDGAPDASAESRLANRIQSLLDGNLV